MRQIVCAMAIAVVVCFSLGSPGFASVEFEGGGGGSVCGGEPPDTIPEPDLGWDPLNKYHRYGDGVGEFDLSAVNPTFANLFDLWVTDGVVARWDSATVAYFVNRVVDADSTNGDDIFPKIWNYFTDADEDPAYGGLQYTFPDDSVYTRIILKLYDNEDFVGACGHSEYYRECTNYSYAQRPFPGEGPYRAYTLWLLAADSTKACGPVTEFTVDDVLTLGFAHELQHACLGLNSPATWYSNVNESLSKLAEYIAGGEQDKTCDISYDTSILRVERCEAERKYMAEQTWMAYLYDRFSNSPSDPTDDLVYRWVREDDVTLTSLAELLEDDDFAWLGGETGDERFRTLFQSFAVAKFADAPDLTSDKRYGYEEFNAMLDLGLMLDNCTFYAPGSCPRRPIDCSGPTSGCGNHAGCWNVKIIPPVYDVTSSNENALATVSDYYEDPGDASRDSIEVATYGTDFIVFKADDYYDDGEQHEFHFDLAKVAGAMPLNTQIQVSVIGYSSVEDTLQLHPEDIVFVAPLSIEAGATEAQCVVTDFGRSIKSVVVVLTLVEPIVVATYSGDFEYFVYEYEYGVFTPEDVSSLQWGGDVFMTGDYEVPDGASLTIDAGTGIHVWMEDLADEGTNDDLIEFLISGDCDAFGTAADPIQIAAFDAEGASTADDAWWGIFVLDGGSATFEHCVFKNANYAVQGNDEISLSGCLIEDTKYLGLSVAYAGTVTVDSTTIRGPEYGINALLGTNLVLSNSIIEDCSLYGVALYKDSKLDATRTTFDGNDIGLYLSRETESWVKGTVYDCTFTDNGDGIWIDDVGDSSVAVDKCTIDDNTTNGIYVEDDGGVTIKRSTITNNTIGVYSYGSNPEIRSHNVIQYNNAGVKCDNYSVAVVESSTVNNNTNAFAVINDADPDLGHATGGSSVGRNIIRPNTAYYVSNLTSNTIVAENNYWPRTPPSQCSPSSTKFYGSVDYSPDMGCSAPSLVSIVEPKPVADVPKQFSISQNYPNPFNPTTTISFDVPDPGARVKIVLYDVGGRLVTTLVDDNKVAGSYQIGWNGRNTRGEPVASGVYFLRMQAGSFLATRKLIMLK